MKRTAFMIAGAAVCLCLVPVARAAQGQGHCAAALLPGDGHAEVRSLRAEDLVRLRDMGASYEVPPWAGMVPAENQSIALSPDGTKLAFSIRRGNPDTNDFCLGIFVLDLAGNTRPIMIDEGGELIRLKSEFRGKAGYPTGIAVSRLPRWTPDGKAVLFLKQVDGVAQVWLAAGDGSGSRPVTHSQDDVLDFRIGEDEHSIIYKTQPGLRAGLKSIEREGREGFHYDNRFAPMASNRPFVPGPLPYRTWVQADGPDARGRQASSEQRALFEPGPAAPPGTVAQAVSRRGDYAWLTVEGKHFPPRLTLTAMLRDGRRMTCTSATCDRSVSQFWWSSEGGLRFMRREGWDREATAIYEWQPGSGEPRRLFLTNDLLASCIPVDEDLICLREASNRPRYISRIALPSGKSTPLYDPNPEFRRLQLGKVERLHWRNTNGFEVFGDLVLPVGYKQGQRYPLVVVQYESRGFLRGGTGDDYPIQLFAAHGFAVLSFDRPIDYGTTVGAKTVSEAQAANDKDFADRRSVQSALETGIGMLVKRGIVDPARIGITGMSDGASTGQFALINSDLFKAAAFSSCCWDSSLAISVGPGAMPTFADTYPSVLSDDDPVWHPVSIARNAARLDVPMLFQISDGELLSTLTGYTALRDHQQPADMYVYPGEYHIKWQPAHRLAIYRRSLAWFEFWLGSDGPIDAPDDELERWDDLRREKAGKGKATQRAPE